MENRTFLNISASECAVVYQEILNNSNKTWDAGLRMAETGEFGLATSLAIISIEEMVKALVVFFDSQGFEFRRVKGIKSIFANHQLRYFIAFLMFVLSLVGDELIKLVKKVNEDPKRMTDWMEKIKLNDAYLEGILFKYLLRKLVIIKKELDWFSKVDIFRQKGFYCDYEDRLKSPLNISEDEYNQLIARLEKVKNVGSELVLVFSSKNGEGHKNLEKLRRHMKDNDLYSKIEMILSNTRKARKTPFDLLKQNFVSAKSK